MSVQSNVNSENSEFSRTNQSRLKSVKLFKLLSKINSVWLFIIFSLTALLAIVPEQVTSTVSFMLDNILHIAPFVIISAILAGYLEAAGADQLVARVFENKAWLAIFLAAMLGAFSPFCSCGVIPLIAALIVSGVPLSAIMAFWISSPVMDPSMFVVTSAGLGLQFALVKTVSAMGLGLFAGISTHILLGLGLFSNPSRVSQLSGCASNNLSFTKPVWAIWKEKNRLNLLANKTQNMVFFLLKWLTFAYLLESLMMTYVPAELFSQWLGGNSIVAVIYASVLGIPAYLNGFAAIPLVSGLIENGMSQGAALAFMLSGSITSIPAGIAVYSLVKRSVFFWYLLLALTGAIFAGITFNMALML